MNVDIYFVLIFNSIFNPTDNLGRLDVLEEVIQNTYHTFITEDDYELPRIEAIEALKGNMQEDVRNVVLELGAYILKLDGKGNDVEENKKAIEEVINDEYKFVKNDNDKRIALFIQFGNFMIHSLFFCNL